jgi:enoyl-CoA hydratase/carnithine racemase
MSQLEKTLLASEQSVGPARLGILELNASKRLNAIDEEMLSEMGRRLLQWEADPGIALVILRSTSPKAFCAGGDVKGLVQAMNAEAPEAVARRFFTLEYSVDHLIHQLKKPTLCFASGITMGGGIGLMNGCKVRLVTQSTQMAMPEISIGLFPDVGASFFLPRLKRNVGWLLGLTGLRISGFDAVYVGWADYALDASLERRLWVDLLRLPWTADADSNLDLLHSYMSVACGQAPVGPLADVLPKIQSFLDQLPKLQFDDAAEVLEQLLDSSPYFAEAKAFWQAGSPTSRRLAHESLKRAQGKSLRECFLQEWNLAVNVSKFGDFREGVRAQLIDKDKAPKWQGEPTDISPYFAEPTPHDLKALLS